MDGTYGIKNNGWHQLRHDVWHLVGGVVYKGAGLAEYGRFPRSLLREEEVH